MCVHALLLRRGFGFVTYVDQTGVDKVLAQNRHELDSKTVSFYLLCCILGAHCMQIIIQQCDLLWFYWAYSFVFEAVRLIFFHLFLKHFNGLNALRWSR